MAPASLDLSLDEVRAEPPWEGVKTLQILRYEKKYSGFTDIKSIDVLNLTDT